MKSVVVGLIGLAAAAVLAAGVLGALHFLNNGSVATASGADHVVPRTEVEKLAKRNYARPFIDTPPQSVTCPRGLRPKKDDTVRCTAVFKGAQKTMLVSVTGVKGDRVSFDYGLLTK